jgi:hypothetical protein
MRAIPDGDFISTAMLVLRRERISFVGGGGVLLCDCGEARSRRRTVAP